MIENLISRIRLVSCCTLFFITTEISSIDTVKAQSHDSLEKIEIRADLPHIVRKQGDLILKIILINKSDTGLKFYNSLNEGTYMNNLLSGVSLSLTNFTCIVEKKIENKYHSYDQGLRIDFAPNRDTTDNIPRRLVDAHDSIAIYFHIDSRYAFGQGKYRIKCSYWNNIRADSSIESHWSYFKVATATRVKHYDENESFTK